MTDSISDQGFPDKVINIAFEAITWQRVVLGALIFFVLSVAFQACTPVLESDYWLPYTVSVTDDSPNVGRNLRLRVTAPQATAIDNSDSPGYPISVSLWRTKPLSPSTQVTYTVAFSATDNLLLLTDKDGIPTSEVDLIVSHDRGKPATLYVQQRSSTFATNETSDLIVGVVDPNQPDSLLVEQVRLSIAVWSRWFIFPFRFFSVLFGPTLTLASSLIVVIGFGLQQVLQRRDKLAEKEMERQQEREKLELEQRKAERFEKERQERQKLEQKLNEVKRIRGYLGPDPGQAIRRWWQYTRWTSILDGKPDWQKPELRDELNTIWLNEIKEIKNPSWQLAILTEAIGSFNTGEYEQAIKRARLIHEIDSADKSSAAIAAQFLIAYMEEKRHQIVNVAQEFGSEKAVEDIWWLYNCRDGELGNIVKPVVVATLAELVGNADTIKAAYKLLNDEGQHLLKEPEFGEVLQSFLAGDHQSEPLDLAGNLQQKRKRNYIWPPLWPRWTQELPTDDETNVLNWLREVSGADFAYNPFGIKQAELDPYFSKHYVYPTSLEPQTGSQRRIRPTVLFGESGCGNTATALLLVDDCQSSRETLLDGEIFPVYQNVQLFSGSDTDVFFYLDTIAQILGKYLVEFLVLNPYAYLDQDDNQKYAVAYLLTYIAGSKQKLKILLKQTNLSNDQAGRYLLRRLFESNRDVPDNFEISRELLVEMLQHSRPYGFTHTYILLDISVASAKNVNDTNCFDQLQPLLDLMLPLARRNVYLKLFLPLVLKNSLILPPGVVSDTISWTPEKLKGLLKERLSSAQAQSQVRIDNLDSLFDPEAIGSNPTDRMIAESRASPGQLISLIDQILKSQANLPPSKRVTYDTLSGFVTLDEPIGSISSDENIA